MSITVDLDFLGVTLSVVGEYTPAVPGRTSGPSEDCYPEEPAEFDIEDILVNGSSIYEMFQCFALPQNTSPIRYRDALDELAEEVCQRLDEGGPDDCDPPEPDDAE